MTNTRLLELEQVVELAKEGKKGQLVIGEHTYQLIANCGEPPTKTSRRRFVFIGIEQLREGQKRFFHCIGCSYSLHDGPGSICVKSLGDFSTLETVFCGRIGREPVFYVEKK